MTTHDKVLALVLGGGRGTRLYPLTKERCKPAISFGGKYRLIDIPLSNCLHSGISKIFILTQFLTTSLHRHIFQTYRLDMLSKGFIEVLPAEQTLTSDSWYLGTADAVRRSLKYISSHPIDEVIILSGDQLCRMNLSEALKFHHEKNADLTIIGSPIEEEEARRMGIIKINENSQIVQMVEKPKDIALVSDFMKDGRYIASTGNYIFKKQVLVDLLSHSDGDDFGKNIIPAAVQNHKVFLYPYGGYWEDIGTIKSFFWANLDLASPLPAFNLYDENEALFTRARFLPAAKIQNSVIRHSLVSEGSIIEDAVIDHSIVGIRSVVYAGARLEKTIVLGNDYYEQGLDGKFYRPHIGRGVEIYGAIIDKNVTIGNNVKIFGLQNAPDTDTDLYCIRDGIVVISKGTVIPAGTVIR